MVFSLYTKLASFKSSNDMSDCTLLNLRNKILTIKWTLSNYTTNTSDTQWRLYLHSHPHLPKKFTLAKKLYK